MTILKNIHLIGSNGKPFLLDLFVEKSNSPKPLVIFAHGFKGFKDWGCWDLVAKTFAKQGFVFIKFNFSHNGTTVDKPNDFADLEAFGNNNFEKELFDLGKVIDWIFNRNIGVSISEINCNKVYLIGHSRGGGSTILKAANDARVAKIATWAAQSDFSVYFVDKENWEKKGVRYILNGRTKQYMPLYWQFAQNYFSNTQKFNIETAAKKLKQPFLIVHGTDDPAVPINSAQNLAKWNQNAQTLLIEGANHVFGGAHPYQSNVLPNHLNQVVNQTIAFFKA